MPSGQKSFCGGAIWLETANGRRNIAADKPVKHLVMQAAM